MEFNNLGINKKILNVLTEEQYIQPTQIQAETIPAALEGRDVLGLAQTGSGKTAAFAIPTLQQLSQEPRNNKKIKALVLTPTRELALQIKESFDIYGRGMHLKTTVIFGGVKQGSQVRQIKAGTDILVATPGRLLDLIHQRIVDISKIKIFILDEADRMLDMGFVTDINKVLKLVPKEKQTLLFSATMPKGIDNIANRLLKNPITVKANPVSSTVDTIKQELIYVDRKNKIHLLVDFFKEHPGEQVLIFSRTKRGADRLNNDLKKYNISAKSIHGDKSQNARQQALNEFKNHEISALIATDIVSRGIDIDKLNFVINFDLPEQAEDYVHRIGRTGRAGESGTAISYCSFQEISLLNDIEKLIKKKIEVMENEEYPLVDKTIKEKKPRANKYNGDRSRNKGKSNYRSGKPSASGTKRNNRNFSRSSSSK